MKTKILLAVSAAVVCVTIPALLSVAALSSASILLSSCTQSGDGRFDVIDAGNPEEVQFTEIADNYRILQLDEEQTPLGAIFHIKCYGDDFFLLEHSRKRLFHYDNTGHLVNILDKLGRGRDEYLDIFSFAFSETDRILYIYSNSQKIIKAYSVSDMSYCRDIPFESYLETMECTDWGTIVAATNKYPSGGAIVSIDLSTDNQNILKSDNRHDRYSKMQASSNCPAGDGSLLLCLPGYPNETIRVSSEGVKTVSKYVLKNAVFNKDYWEGSYTQEKDISFQIDGLRHPDKFNRSAFYVGDRKHYCFWAVTGYLHDEETLLSGEVMYLVISGKSYKVLLPDGSIINPIGMTDTGEYVSLVRTEQIKDYLNEDVRSEQSLVIYSF